MFGVPAQPGLHSSRKEGAVGAVLPGDSLRREFPARANSWPLAEIPNSMVVCVLCWYMVVIGHQDALVLFI